MTGCCAPDTQGRHVFGAPDEAGVLACDCGAVARFPAGPVSTVITPTFPGRPVRSLTAVAAALGATRIEESA